MSRNAEASVLLEFLADGCRAGVLALTDVVVTYGARAAPNRVAFTAESLQGRKGTPNEASLEEVAFWLDRFRTGKRRALMVTPVPDHGLGPSAKVTFHITYD